jgi:hypothetical protein
MQQEIGVFEPTQDCQVQGYAGGQPGAGMVGMSQCPRDRMVEHDRTNQKRQMFRVPPGVEEQTARHQPAQRPDGAEETTEREEPRQADREKFQNERGGMEHHGV